MAAAVDLFAEGGNMYARPGTLRLRYMNDDVAGRVVFLDTIRSITAYFPMEVSPPGAIEPLHFAAADTLRWEDAWAPGAFRFNVYRGATAGSRPEIS